MSGQGGKGRLSKYPSNSRRLLLRNELVLFYEHYITVVLYNRSYKPHINTIPYTWYILYWYVLFCLEAWFVALVRQRKITKKGGAGGICRNPPNFILQEYEVYGSQEPYARPLGPTTKMRAPVFRSVCVFFFCFNFFCRLASARLRPLYSRRRTMLLVFPFSVAHYYIILLYCSWLCAQAALPVPHASPVFGI